LLRAKKLNIAAVAIHPLAINIEKKGMMIS